MVMDARTGKVLHARNADTRLHPASLTKMMTLYIVFEAVKRGEISLDTKVRISKNAAAEPPSKLGLRAGQRIALRYLIRAAAVKSANDAATALGEAISGSEAAFAQRMNRTAKALGMTRTTFKNANGLTTPGHLSTARDMTMLGRRMIYDYPQYYNIFSRRSTDAGIKTVRNTNSRLLNAYRGADGIKTGYTRAAGFNLVASAERGSERVIATVFGGRSTATRNARVAELLDLGFRKAPTTAAVRRPKAPNYAAVAAATPRNAQPTRRAMAALPFKGRTRPKLRPGTDVTPPLLVAAAEIEKALNAAKTLDAPIATTAAQVQTRPVLRPTATMIAAAPTQTPGPEASTLEATLAEQLAPTQTPVLRATVAMADASPDTSQDTVAIAPVPAPILAAVTTPKTRPTLRVEVTTPAIEPIPANETLVVSSPSNGTQDWGINLGPYPSRSAAEKSLIQVTLASGGSLARAKRQVVSRGGRYDAMVNGLTRENADLACRRLQARSQTCFMVSPG